MYQTLASCTSRTTYDVPIEMVNQMDSYAVLTVMEYVYTKEHNMPQEEIYRCLDSLLL